MSMRYITVEEIELAAIAVSARIDVILADELFPVKIYGVPRGGIPAAMAVCAAGIGMFEMTSDPTEALIIIDDLIDSGKTRDRYTLEYPNTPFFALFTKTNPTWLVMPWEATEESSACDIPTRLLQYIGEDVARGGLIETPKRFLKAWKEKTSGYGLDPNEALKVFSDGAENYDQMIVVKDIEVESVCEHHMERIWGVAHIAYIPNGKIVGLSKLSRLVDVFSRRLQVQERLTVQIAECLEKNLQPLGVGVVIEARHGCIESRGIQKRGQTTVTSSLKGVLRDDPSARAEFLNLAATKKDL